VIIGWVTWVIFLVKAQYFHLVSTSKLGLCTSPFLIQWGDVVNCLGGRSHRLGFSVRIKNVWICTYIAFLYLLIIVLVFIYIASLLGEVNTDRTSIQWISAASLSYSWGKSKCMKCLKYLPLKQKYTVFGKCRYGSNFIKNGNILNYLLKWKTRNILIAARIKIVSQMAATDYWSFISQQYCNCVDYNLHKWLRGEDDYKLLLAKDAHQKKLQTSWSIILHKEKSFIISDTPK
jgi:hypothetical protein